MPFTIAVPVETKDADTRVALTPDDVAQLRSNLAHAQILVERGAGTKSEFADSSYTRQGAVLIDSRHEMFQTADIIARVKRSDATTEVADLNAARCDSMWIGFLDPQIANRAHLSDYASHSITGIAFEMLPQRPELAAYDATGAMSRVTGQVVIDEAANRLGGLSGKRVLVLGIGNAGLEAARFACERGADVTAISTSMKHCGALDLLKIPLLQIPDERGHENVDSILSAQRLEIANILASGDFDVVVCSARRARKPAPQLITRDAILALQKPTLFYDLTASSGGNCEGTVYGKEISVGNALLLSKTGYPKSRPNLASTHYSQSLSALARKLFAGNDDIAMDAALNMTVTVPGMVHPELVQAGLTQVAFNDSAQRSIQEFRERALR